MRVADDRYRDPEPVFLFGVQRNPVRFARKILAVNQHRREVAVTLQYRRDA